MLYENYFQQDLNKIYGRSAQFTNSWHRSNWSKQENQEAGFNQIASLIQQHKDARSVLDVGCGDGRIIDFLPTQIDDYTGIDITEEIVKVADNPLIHHADIKTYQPGRKFDIVFAIGSFNMGVPLQDVIAALEAMHNLSNIATICNISYLTPPYENEPGDIDIITNLGFNVTINPFSFSNGYGDKYTIIKLH